VAVADAKAHVAALLGSCLRAFPDDWRLLRQLLRPLGVAEYAPVVRQAWGLAASAGRELEEGVVSLVRGAEDEKLDADRAPGLWALLQPMLRAGAPLPPALAADLAPLRAAYYPAATPAAPCPSDRAAAALLEPAPSKALLSAVGPTTQQKALLEKLRALRQESEAFLRGVSTARQPDRLAALAALQPPSQVEDSRTAL
jgi:hypothetical protein